MAIDITVLRGVGLVQGDDIVDPLLSTLAAALARGRHELNETSTGLVDRDLEVPFTAGIEVGEIAHIVDDFLVEEYVGRIENIDISVKSNPPSAVMQLKLVVPEAFFQTNEVVIRGA